MRLCAVSNGTVKPRGPGHHGSHSNQASLFILMCVPQYIKSISSITRNSEQLHRVERIVLCFKQFCLLQCCNTVSLQLLSIYEVELFARLAPHGGEERDGAPQFRRLAVEHRSTAACQHI